MATRKRTNNDLQNIHIKVSWFLQTEKTGLNTIKTLDIKSQDGMYGRFLGIFTSTTLTLFLGII